MLVPSLELVAAELVLEARPLSKLVVELRHPPKLPTTCVPGPTPPLEREDDSTVPILALLSSPGLSLPGLYIIIDNIYHKNAWLRKVKFDVFISKLNVGFKRHW